MCFNIKKIMIIIMTPHCFIFEFMQKVNTCKLYLKKYIIINFILQNRHRKYWCKHGLQSIYLVKSGAQSLSGWNPLPDLSLQCGT